MRNVAYSFCRGDLTAILRNLGPKPKPHEPNPATDLVGRFGAFDGPLSTVSLQVACCRDAALKKRRIVCEGPRVSYPPSS